MLIILILLIAFIVSPLYAENETAPSTVTSSFSDCNAQDIITLEQALKKHIANAMYASINELNISILVNKHWNGILMDDTIDQSVDYATALVQNDLELWDKVASSWSGDKAKQLTEQVAERAFNSEFFRNKIERLVGLVAEDLTEEMQILTQHSVQASLQCLQEYIGKEYSHVIIDIFQEEMERDTLNLGIASSDESNPSLSQMRLKGIAGIAVIITAQVGRMIATRLVQRITGRIIQRVIGRAVTSSIPFIGWLVGGGMIIWDVISSSKGALPIIQKELKKQEVKDDMQEELILAIQQGLTEEVPDLSENVALSIINRWQDFTEKFATVLELAEQLPILEEILLRTDSNKFYQLSNLVDILYEDLGAEQLKNSLQDKSFDKLLSLPEAALTLLKNERSIEITLDWAQISQELLTAVVNYEIYKHRTPEDFNKESIRKLVYLEDEAAISKIILLETEDMNYLLDLSSNNLKNLASNLTSQELNTLSWYMKQLNQEESNQIISHLLYKPEMIKKLSSEDTKQTILYSHHKRETIDFILSPTSLSFFIKDVKAMADQQVPFDLFIAKYRGLLNVLLIILGLFIFLRIIFPSRRRKT